MVRESERGWELLHGNETESKLLSCRPVHYAVVMWKNKPQSVNQREICRVPLYNSSRSTNCAVN